MHVLFIYKSVAGHSSSCIITSGTRAQRVLWAGEQESQSWHGQVLSAGRGCWLDAVPTDTAHMAQLLLQHMQGPLH
jgi:hypothetical protein